MMYSIIILSILCFCNFLPGLLPRTSREPSLRALRKRAVIEETNNFTCAPHIPKQNRKVLYINAIGMEKYASNLEQKYIFGEFYALASWEHAIQQNGFIVEDEVTFEEVLDLPDTWYHSTLFFCSFSFFFFYNV